MDQHCKSVNRSAAPIAREVLSLMFWVMRHLLRVLLRRPILDVLLLLLALWLLAGLIGTFTQPQQGLPQLPTALEGR